MENGKEIYEQNVDFLRMHPVIKTGFKTMEKDSMLRSGCIHLIASRPAMGKTMFAYNLAANVLKRGEKVCVISFNETKRRLINQIMSIRGMNEAFLDNLFIEYGREMGSSSIKTVLDDIKNNHSDASLIVIDPIEQFGLDNIQWVRGYFPNSAVLCLCSVKREAEQRESHIPGLDDVICYEKVKAYVDSVYAIYREEYYDFESNSKLLHVINLKSDEHDRSFTLERDGYSLYDVNFEGDNHEKD